MAYTFDALQEEIDLRFTQGDDFSLRIDWGMDITGYTWDAEVLQSEITPIPFTITTSAYTPSGILYLDLNHNQTGLISPEARWYLKWTTSGNKMFTPYVGNLIPKDFS
jgi:hypothetical protein